MRRPGFVALGLLVIFVTAQGCSTFDAIFLELLKASGRLLPDEIPCGAQTVQVFPGHCAFISNTCRVDSDFVRGDAFALDDPPEWLSVTRFSDTTRELCAAPDAPPVIAPFPYTYVGEHFQHGVLTVQTVADFRSAVASATPSAVTVGQSTQLNVMPQDGQGPFTFAWRQSAPAGSVSVFNHAFLQSPLVTIIAAPSGGVVTFAVTVTDVAGQTVEADVTVGVNGLPLRVTATATPSTITRGASSQLLAVVEGGIPPYGYQWGSILDLSFEPGFLDPNPVATPRDTETFTVEVHDSGGQTVTSSVTVTVIQPAGADLVVTVTDSPDPVVFNRLLTYTVRVTNNGPEIATGVSLMVTPPQQAESNGLTPSQGTCTRSGGNFSCAIGTMASGATVTATIDMFPFVAGPISLTATATTTAADPNIANNAATQTTTVLAQPN